MKEEHKEIDPFINNFVSVYTFEALVHTEHETQELIWESRIGIDRKRLLFTVMNGIQVRIGSFREFFIRFPESKSLTIKHSVKVLWNGERKQAKLLEILKPQENQMHAPLVRVELMIAEKKYQVEECPTLTDAIWGLAETIGNDIDWWLMTCHHCIYSYPNFGWETEDRDELQCYRDKPDQFKEIQSKGKASGQGARSGGQYYVNAFHYCAGWKPLKSTQNT